MTAAEENHLAMFGPFGALLPVLKKEIRAVCSALWVRPGAFRIIPLSPPRLRDPQVTDASWVRRDTLASGDDPDRMHDSGNVSKDRQQNVKPELQADTDLKKNTKRRQEDCNQDADKVHVVSSFLWGCPMFQASLWRNALMPCIP